jgi:hypothetical protein
MRRRCLDKLRSAKPGIVKAKCDVIWRIARGPWLRSKRDSFSGVTAAAAANAMGELVLRGGELPWGRDTPPEPRLDFEIADNGGVVDSTLPLLSLRRLAAALGALADNSIMSFGT